MASAIPHTSKPAALDAKTQPSATDTDLVLEPANALEYVHTWYLNADEWKGPLSLDQYLERETYLKELDLTKDAQITAWILTSSTLPPNEDGSRPILAACETLLKHAYVARNGKVDKILAHGIASVYTRPEYRGKGYAGRMMAELGRKLESWQQKDQDKGTFSVLYSDIGQEFYTRFGWEVFPSTHIILQPMDQAAYGELRHDHPHVGELDSEDVANIPAAQYVEEDLRQLSTQKPEVPYVAVRPDIEHFAWHHAREEFQAKALGKGFPEVKGAIHRATGVALVWCRVYASKPADWQLQILHTVIPNDLKDSSEAEEALAALLLRAQLEAHDWEMVAGVEVWDPQDIVVRAAQRLRKEEEGKVEVISRDKEHVCSLRWIGGRPEDKEGPVVWLSIEKYAWC